MSWETARSTQAAAAALAAASTTAHVEEVIGRPPKWSPRLRHQPVKDILHAATRVVFRRCKSDDHFTPFLRPFGDCPWQKSKLLCRAPKALCGVSPRVPPASFVTLYRSPPRSGRHPPTAPVTLSTAGAFGVSASLLLCSSVFYFSRPSTVDTSPATLSQLFSGQSLSLFSCHVSVLP